VADPAERGILVLESPSPWAARCISWIFLIASAFLVGARGCTILRMIGEANGTKKLTMGRHSLREDDSAGEDW